MTKIDLATLSPTERQKLMADLEAQEKAEKVKIKEDRETYKKMAAEFVEENINVWVNHREATERLVEELFNNFQDILKIKELAYGERVRNQESNTVTLEDGSASLTLGHNVVISFDGTENAGIEKIKRFLHSLGSDDPRSKMQSKVVDVLLRLNPKTGQLNPSKIIELSKLSQEFNSEEFNEGLQIIFDAQQRKVTSQYVSGWKIESAENGRKKKIEFRFSV